MAKKIIIGMLLGGLVSCSQTDGIQRSIGLDSDSNQKSKSSRSSNREDEALGSDESIGGLHKESEIDVTKCDAARSGQGACLAIANYAGTPGTYTVPLYAIAESPNDVKAAVEADLAIKACGKDAKIKDIKTPVIDELTGKQEIVIEDGLAKFSFAFNSEAKQETPYGGGADEDVDVPDTQKLRLFKVADVQLTISEDAEGFVELCQAASKSTVTIRDTSNRTSSFNSFSQRVSGITQLSAGMKHVEGNNCDKDKDEDEDEQLPDQQKVTVLGHVEMVSKDAIKKISLAN